MRFRLRALAVLSVMGTALLAGGQARASVPAVQALPAVRAVQAGVPGPVVLLGTGGVSWTDVEHDHLPVLSGLLAHDSSGWLADRSVRALTCPVDGWLAVSAGKRAADVPVGPTVGQKTAACRQPAVQIGTAGGAAVVPQWPDYLRQATADTYEAVPGLLAGTLTAAGKVAAAVGPGAAIALADGQGTVTRAWAGGQAGTGAVDPTGLTTDVRSALATSPDLLVVDLGAVRDPARRLAGEPAPTGAYAAPRQVQERALDTRLGQVLAELPPEATVIVASIADSGTPSRLQLLAARGPAAVGGTYLNSLLGSTSTRQDGLAQTTDLLPTALTALNVQVPDAAVGSALRPVEAGASPSHRHQKLDDVGAAAAGVAPILPWFLNGLVIAQIVLYGVATLVLRRRSRSNDPSAAIHRRRTLRFLRQGSIVFASVPAATFLANLLPWWRAGPGGLSVTVAVIVFVIPIAALALLGPWRTALLGPFGAVGAVTALVLGGDVVTGSHLMLSSLLGVNPIVAGRFYGFGNLAFAVFVTGALVLAIALADHLLRLDRARQAAVVVAVIGLAAVVCDGTPGLGSDFGGPPAIIPGFAVLALLVAGVRVTWRRALLIALVTIAVIVLLAVIDWLRPPTDRTHLGRFVQTVIDGGAWPVVRRKADANIRILFISWLTILLPFAVAFVVLVLARPVAWGVRPLQLAYDRSPVLKHGIIAFGVMMLLAAGLNDSGLPLVAMAATVAIPLLIAASVRALELQDGEGPKPSLMAAGMPTESG